VPEVEALLPRFRAANTQVLGISVDTVYSHANWGKSLGGVSFPLLADFQPKGGVAKSYDAYLEGPGIGDRATVIIDSSGVVRYSVSVGPPGRRKIEDLAAECEKLSGDTVDFAEQTPLSDGATLYVKSSCGASRATLLARTNLHLDSKVAVKNVSEDDAAKAALNEASGKDQAPCLVEDGKALHESADIVSRFATSAAPLYRAAVT
jgi:hypothetical protein